MSSYYLFSETTRQFFKEGQLAAEYSLELGQCPVCDGKKFRKLFSFEGFHYYACRNCTFVFTNPRLNEMGSAVWYNSPYYNAALAKEIYINSQKEAYFSGSLSYEHFLEIVKTIERCASKDDRIIDVGCSTGSILAYLKNELGFSDLTGIDLNQAAVEFAQKQRGLKVELADITSLAEEAASYDIVINTENIEHVNKLDEYIANIKGLLKEGGHLLVSTPHNDPRAVKLLGVYGDHFCAPNHINYFNKHSMERFLEKHGFEIVSFWLGQDRSFSLYAFIKSKLFVPDQLSADSPYEAYFDRPIRKKTQDRRAYVKLRPITNPWLATAEVKQPNPKRRPLQIFKNLLNRPLGLSFDNHMIVLARKKEPDSKKQSHQCSTANAS